MTIVIESTKSIERRRYGQSQTALERTDGFIGKRESGRTRLSIRKDSEHRFCIATKLEAPMRSRGSTPMTPQKGGELL